MQNYNDITEQKCEEKINRQYHEQNSLFRGRLLV